jgi:hypothetical protein
MKNQVNSTSFIPSSPIFRGWLSPHVLVLILILLFLFAIQPTVTATAQQSRLASSSNEYQQKRNLQSKFRVAQPPQGERFTPEERLFLEKRKKEKLKKPDPVRQEMRLQKLRELNIRAMNKLQQEYDGLQEVNRSLSFMPATVPPLPVTAQELRGRKCSFSGASCATESIEHQLVRKYIQADDVVLELGGRFGTTSCEISKMLNNSGKQVVVEPDENVWYLLALNRLTHHCSFWIYRGIISQYAMSIAHGSYDTRTIPVTNKNKPDSSFSSTALNSMTIHQIQKELNLTFSVLLIDCEGCIQSLFEHAHDETNSFLKWKQEMSHVKTIILEGDMSFRSPFCFSNCIDYKPWIVKFLAIGFHLVSQVADPEFADIVHYVLQRRHPYS